MVELASDVARSRKQKKLETEAAHQQHVLDTLHDQSRPMGKRAAFAKKQLSKRDVQQVESLSDEDAEREVGVAALKMKRENPAGFKQMLASLPAEERKHVLNAVALEQRR